MVFPIDYKKDFDNGIKSDENEEDIKGKEKQEEQQKAGKGKQPLTSLSDRKKVDQFSDRNKGKPLPTQVSSYPPFNRRPKILKEPLKNNIHVQTPTQTPTIVGPYGCQVGVCWDDGSHTSVRQIVIVSGNCVESIHIEYDDGGKSLWSQKHGGLGKFYQDKIILDHPDEFLISVSGYYDANRIHIMSLTFHSNVRLYGPYGVESGVYFTFPSTGGKIIGFHGRCSECLYAIGAYYEHCDKNYEPKSGNSVKNGVVGDPAEIPVSVGPFGGNAGSPWNDGVYTTIRQLVVSNSDSGINSIHLEYDKNGSSEWSEEHGERVQSGINTVNLDYPNEFFIAISGFYSSESVQGLTFQTNKKTYGPFGKEEGKHFSTPSTGGKIVGFHGYCDVNLVSIGAYFEPIVYSYSKTQNPMSVGPFGGRGGGLFDDGTFTGVRRLTIASGTVIDSISIEYDNNGCSVTSRLHGGSGGENNQQIILDYPNEFLISAWGYIYESDTLVIVRSLTLQSNRKTYGPYGSEQGKKFSFPSTGGKIIGFHGKSGQYLDAIGVYLEPTTHNLPSSKNPARLENASEKASSSTNELDELLSVPSTDQDECIERLSRPMIYGPWGGLSGRTFDDGVFTGVRAVQLTRNGALTSIRVLYDRGGQPVWGTKNGGSFGLRSDMIEFDYPSEVLTHISGYYQSTIFKGSVAITSITLHTTKQTYGPFGTKEGVYFTSGVGDGTIVGFHGRKGKYVNGIGVHLLSVPTILLVSYNEILQCMPFINFVGTINSRPQQRDKMVLAGVEPTGVTVTTVISACASLKALPMGKELHFLAVRTGLIRDILGIVLTAKAYDLFMKMRESDVPSNVISWNVMISGLYA